MQHGASLLGRLAWGLLSDPTDGVAVDLARRFESEAGRAGVRFWCRADAEHRINIMYAGRDAISGKHLFVAKSSKAADALIAVLKENSQMYTTQIVDCDAWYVPFIAPKEKSLSWWLISMAVMVAGVGPGSSVLDVCCGTGDFVEVPLGPRRVLGVVWGEADGRFPREKLRALPLFRQAAERDGRYIEPAMMIGRVLLEKAMFSEAVAQCGDPLVRLSVTGSAAMGAGESRIMSQSSCSRANMRLRSLQMARRQSQSMRPGV